jgi:hypothetical protein
MRRLIKWSDLMLLRILPYSLAILFAASSVYLYKSYRQVKLEIQKNNEAAEIDKLNLTRAHQKTVKELTRDLDETLADKKILKRAIEDIKKKIPSARVVRIMKASTGPVPMDKDAIEALCATKKSAQKQGDTQPIEDAQTPFTGEILVDTVDLRTDAGNLIATGWGEAWQVAPGPRRRLFSGKFDAPATQVSELALEPPEMKKTIATWKIIAGSFGAGVLSVFLYQQLK